MRIFVISLIVLCAANLAVSAQTAVPRGVPAVVLNAFQQQFPKARLVEWEKQKSGNYEVEFVVGLMGRDQQAVISPEGKLMRHEEDLSSTSLPDAIKKQLKADFDGYRVSDVKKVTSGGNIHYEVELESRQGDLKVDFDPEGKVLKERLD